MAIATAGKATKRERVFVEEPAFRRQLKGLRRRYPNQFVALSRGRVIGHGSNDETLAQRMFTKLAHSEFAIFLVSEKPEMQEFSGPDF